MGSEMCIRDRRLAKKKRIGPFRADEESRRENRQKDMGTLVRAGFGYDTAQKIMDLETVSQS